MDSGFHAATSRARHLSLVSAGALLALIVASIAATLWLCGGHFIYSLDDPYITLALGWQIGHGHYGLNAFEASSPSSSILYPFLLAAVAHTSLYEWAPLIINSLATLASVTCLAHMLVRYSIVREPADLTTGAALLVALCVGINLLGVVFSGLEHSLHILSSILIIYGLARTLQDKRVPPWLVMAVVLAPLLRFEGLALSGLTIVVLTIIGQRRAAVVAAVAIVGTLASYLLAMHLLGLPPLPSSVLVKAPAFGTSHAGILGIAWGGLLKALHYKQAFPLGVCFFLLLLHPVLRGATARGANGAHLFSWRDELLFVGTVAGAVAAHVMFGSWGWWYRYEIYLLALTVAATLVVWRVELHRFLSTARPWHVALVVLVLLGTSPLYLRATVLNPIAARGVYEQQYQMHRFAVEFYRAPVAANDIGWLSYGNPNYVLDLWGLGSESARKARLVTHQAGWMSELTTSHNVSLAIVYESWFRGQLPSTWQRVAIMRNAHEPINGSGSEVAFYATNSASVPDVLAALGKFKPVVGGLAQVTLEEPLAAR